MMIRNSLFAAVALLMTGCGIYKPYTRPEVTTDGIYREPVTPTDTASLADLDWRALFPDERLQQLIDTVLVRNTDLRTAQLQSRRPKRRSALHGSRCSPPSRSHPRAA